MLCELTGVERPSLTRLKAAIPPFKGLELADIELADQQTYYLWLKAHFEMGKPGEWCEADALSLTKQLVEIALRVAADSGKRMKIKWEELH